LDLTVPETAQNLYEKVDVYRNQTGNLELIVEMYNNMLSTLLPVEKPLLADRIEKMGNALQSGIDTLRWNSENINPFINNAMKIVTDVDILVKKMKDNVHKIHQLMEMWQKPLYERKKTFEPDVVQ
jgi:dynein heavy chain